MLYIETTSNVSPASLRQLLRHRIQGSVTLRRHASLYAFYCQHTPQYQDVLSFIHQHGGFPLLVDGMVLIVKHYVYSKL